MFAPDNDPLVVLEDVWKTYPPEREPHPVLLALARLGGVELDGGSLADMDDDDGDELEDEEDELQPVAEPASVRRGSVDALRGVSLVVEPGTRLGIVGPPGSGKSVLLRLIAGLAPPSAGRVVVRGVVAPALPSLERLVSSRDGTRKALLALAMMTRLPRGEVKRRLPEIFDLAGLPHAGVGLGTKLTPQQRKRVLLAMMLLVDADSVLVDLPLEPGRWRSRFIERIDELTRAGTAIVIAADSADAIADIADNVVHLEEGRIVVDDGGGAIAVEEPEAPVAANGGGAEISATVPQRPVEIEVVPEPPRLPLSPDASRYLDYIRVLVGDRRADAAYRAASAGAPPGTERVEWIALARGAHFDYVEHLPIIERLREMHSVTGEEPIFGFVHRPRDLPLSPDASRYLDYIRVLLGETRAEHAARNAAAYAPEHAVRVEWSWIARWAGFDYIKHVAVIERLRASHGVGDEEPIFGAVDARRKRRP